MKLTDEEINANAKPMDRKMKKELIIERSHQQTVGESQEDYLLKKQAVISYKAGAEAQLAKFTPQSEEKLREELYKAITSEEFEDSCLFNITAKPCQYWNKSASYCMRKEGQSCRKLDRLLPIIQRETAAGKRRIEELEAQVKQYQSVINDLKNNLKTVEQEARKELIIQLSCYAHLQSDESGIVPLDIPISFWQSLKAEVEK